MFWKSPRDRHIIYEALSAIADNRFEHIDEKSSKCTSTSRGKFYTVVFDRASMSMMSNDNMAFYNDELSYPMVAMLLTREVLHYDTSIVEHLKGIKWKDLNQANKNDYMKSVMEVLKALKEKGIDIERIDNEASRIFEEVKKLKLSCLGTKASPPKAY